MIVKSRLGTRGRVIIPKYVRHILGLRGKEKVIFKVEDGEVRIMKNKSY